MYHECSSSGKHGPTSCDILDIQTVTYQSLQAYNDTHLEKTHVLCSRYSSYLAETLEKQSSTVSAEKIVGSLGMVGTWSRVQPEKSGRSDILT